MNKLEKITPYAKVIVRLLQSDIDTEDKLWSDLLKHQIPITEYFERIGIEVIIKKEDGYAYLQQLELDEEGSTIGLMRRIPLTYEVSVVCVLLREMLEDFETSDVLARNFYVSHKRLKEYIELFFKEKSNRVKFLRNLDAHVTKIIELGFLRVQENNDNPDERLYEVKRILKAKISIEQLESFKNKLRNVEPIQHRLG